MKLLAGNSNLPLAKAIADYLDMKLTEASVRRFADEEVFVEINENVRGEAYSAPIDQLPDQRHSDGLRLPGRASGLRPTLTRNPYSVCPAGRKPGRAPELGNW